MGMLTLLNKCLHVRHRALHLPVKKQAEILLEIYDCKEMATYTPAFLDVPCRQIGQDVDMQLHW